MILENSTLANFDENREFIGFGIIQNAATSIEMKNICVSDWTAHAIAKGSQEDQFAAIEYFCRYESQENIKQILSELRLLDFSLDDAAEYGNWLCASDPIAEPSSVFEVWADWNDWNDWGDRDCTYYYAKKGANGWTDVLTIHDDGKFYVDQINEEDYA